MKVFGKRLGYRVGGGVATILLGVLAAVGAQQQQGGPDMAAAPTLEKPDWAEPMPIAVASPDSSASKPNEAEKRQAEPSNWAAAAPASFLTTDDPAESFQVKPAEYLADDTPETNAAANAPSLGPAMVLPVGYELDEPAGSEASTKTPQEGHNEAEVQPLNVPAAYPNEPVGSTSEPVASDSAGPASTFAFPGNSGQQAPDNALRSGSSGGPMENVSESPTESFDTPSFANPPSFAGGPSGETVAARSIEDASTSTSPNASLSMPAPVGNESAAPEYAPPAFNVSGPSMAMPAAQDSTSEPSRYSANDSLPSLPPAATSYPNGDRSSQPMAYEDSATNRSASPGQPSDTARRGVSMNTTGELTQAGPMPGRSVQPSSISPSNQFPPTNHMGPTGPTGQMGQSSQVMSQADAASRDGSQVPGRFASYGQPDFGATASAANPRPATSPQAFSSPGDRRLEGAQTPSLAIHKTAPAEVKVGQPATFVIHVKNVGTTEAMNVQVHDRIPAGMRLVDSAPAPDAKTDALVWSIGAMPPGDQRTITMQLVPMEEGELGSVARVTFEAAASVRTRSTRPELKIVQQVREDVLIGQQLEIDIEVSNVGTGAATGVVLQVDVPEGLEHPRGRQLDNALGSLRPGETRREVLRLRAVAPGVIENSVRLIAEDAEPAQHTARFEVTSPQLNVALNGPNRRFLERQATYQIQLENLGTAAATNVELIAYLDRGLTFVSTENAGQYDPNRHAVLWSLPSLPAGEAGSVPVTLLPVKEGEQAIRLEAIADLGAQARRENVVAVESQAELTFSIADTADPIELGSETTYEIRVQNSGSRNDTGVQVALQLPPGMELLQSDADAQTDGRGRVVFAPAPQLAAGDELVYRVRVRGVQPDTHVVDAVVTSDQSQVPVKKQESTMVYADR